MARDKYMDRDVDDGGAAFATPPAKGIDGLTGEECYQEGQPGMSLRDYFAAAALQGLLANSREPTDMTLITDEAYYLAERMIEDRKYPHPESE